MTATLFINMWDSRCGSCGKAANPDEKTHETVPPGYTRKPVGEGCGVEWTHVSSDYVSALLDTSIAKMRPDLERIQHG